MQAVQAFACLAVALSLVGGVDAHNDYFDKVCWDTSTNMTVASGDCPHGCCVDLRCGSEMYCRTRIVIPVVVVAAVVLFTLGLAAFGFIYSTKRACFAKKNDEKKPLLSDAEAAVQQEV
eukprot:TRINITY_DN26316_c0_g1_i1.p4 TRINITY_DN26316_c0_g1~~TRINITY_DN26316_c0_g1_i1.p4  ORF type:complete len:119 (+),score=35.32 TRINITY_DN26316_c0_g1_i1:210-566(+)